MTDCEIVLDILSDRQWHHVKEIMVRGKGPNCMNWAVRSRIAEINQRDGYFIESRISKDDGMAEYRLKCIPGEMRNELVDQMKRAAGVKPKRTVLVIGSEAEAGMELMRAVAKMTFKEKEACEVQGRPAEPDLKCFVDGAGQKYFPDIVKPNFEKQEA
jgi:hypothetical protein